MDIQEIRRANLRALIEKHSATGLGKKLGYSQPTFLTQMAGPNPSRLITEKTARSYEVKLGLPVGALDEPPAATASASSAPAAPSVNSAANTAMVADVIRMVGSIMSSEHVELPAMKFADVVALAYVDMMEHDGAARPEHIKQIVRLLK